MNPTAAEPAEGSAPWMAASTSESRALVAAGGPAPTRLRVHPHVVDALSDLAPEEISIIGDGGLGLGEFVTETTGPDITFRYERALGQARKALHEDRRPA